MTDEPLLAPTLWTNRFFTSHWIEGSGETSTVPPASGDTLGQTAIADAKFRSRKPHGRCFMPQRVEQYLQGRPLRQAGDHPDGGNGGRMIDPEMKTPMIISAHLT